MILLASVALNVACVAVVYVIIAREPPAPREIIREVVVYKPITDLQKLAETKPELAKAFSSPVPTPAVQLPAAVPTTKAVPDTRQVASVVKAVPDTFAPAQVVKQIVAAPVQPPPAAVVMQSLPPCGCETVVKQMPTRVVYDPQPQPQQPVYYERRGFFGRRWR